MATEAVSNFSCEGKATGIEKAGAGAAASGRRGLNAYIAAVTLAAVVLTTMLALYRPFASTANMLTGAVLLVLICIAEMYPIKVAPKTNVSVTGAGIFTAVLLFDPLAAVSVAGGGVALAQFFKKKERWTNRIFDISQSVLFIGAASLVYAALGVLDGATTLNTAYGLLRAVSAATAMYMVNSAAVSLAAGLQVRKNPVGIWVEGTKQAAVQETALFAIGLASAMVVQYAPWAIVLMLTPVVVVYYSFKRMAALNARVENQLAELKATQAQLVETARMASIGTMVAGIAHQINNPMFVIRGRAETLHEDAEEHLKTPSARKAVQVIFEMADRVSRIVNSLLPVSRVCEDGMVCCDVSEVASNTLLLLESKLLKSGVKVSATLAEDLPACMGDACEVQEMLINLVDNACNAMPQGGKLSLATSVTEAGIVIRVADTGTGIAPENMASVFNPFFTTRKSSGGVGLGLYVSKHIAEKNGGSIAVDSRVGTGTVFTITLPVGTQKMVKVEPQPHEARIVASGR